MTVAAIQIETHDPADLLDAVTSALWQGETTWLTWEGKRRAVIAPAPNLPVTAPGELAYEGEVRYADGTRVSLQCFEARHDECPDQTTEDDPADGPLEGRCKCECACKHGPAAERSIAVSPPRDQPGDAAQLAKITSHLPPDPQDQQGTPIAIWQQAVRAQYAAAQGVARMIADTLRTQFGGAAYLVLETRDDVEHREHELFPYDIRDASGVVLCDFSSPGLPPIDHASDLRGAWGALDPSDAFQLRWLLRQLRVAGAVFDQLPEALIHADDPEDGSQACLLLSGQASPQTPEWTDPVGLGERLLRPYAGSEQDEAGAESAGEEE